VELAKLCAEVIAEYEIVRPDRVLRFAPDLDTERLWDGDRLAQVATNLIGNAIQHGEPDRPIDIRVSAEGRRRALDRPQRRSADPPRRITIDFRSVPSG
jgi:signal transduction histidine kinase